jgi:hypothetical protein
MLPPDLPQKSDVKIYNRPSVNPNTEWFTWQKPHGSTMIFMYCIGGGAGGGGGESGIAGSARGGGSGGGSSAVSRLLVPAFMLPDTLYIQVGKGGLGGTAGVAGASGVLSFVSIAPNFTNTNNLLASGTAEPTGGAGGGSGASSGGTVASVGNTMPRAGLGVVDAVAGWGGVTGGASSGQAGASHDLPNTSVPTMGGTGGGGTTSADFAGGGINQISNSYLTERAPKSAAAGSNHGSSGYVIWNPFFSYGGLGGGSSNTGVGGNGGYGGNGSGGGGGGGGTTGGRGGDGGSGLVMIASW